MEVIELREILLVLYKRKRIILLVLLLTLSISGVISYFLLDPVYETFTTLMVVNSRNNNEKIDYSDILLNQKIITTYGEIAKSRIVAGEVIDNLKLNMDHKDFEKKIKVQIVRDTEIIKVIVEDKDPQLAVQIADEFSKIFIKNIKRIMQIENIQIIDRAELPMLPIKPKPILNMGISVMTGMLITLTYILLSEYLDVTLKTSDDIVKCLSLPVIGMLPQLRSKKVRKNQINGDIVLENEDNKFPIAEAFRILRTNIQFLSLNKSIKSIVITSSEPAEGKSFVAVNLAITFAKGNKKILLVDSDLRKPRIHNIFFLLNIKGLSNVLYEGLDYKQHIRPSNIHNLDILTSGTIPPNPSELLESDGMKSLLRMLEEEYDMIILDSPPAGLVTDASVLGAMTDGVILVCAVKQTLIEEAKNTVALLKNTRSNLLGVVMNRLVLKKDKHNKYKSYFSRWDKKVETKKEKRALKND